MQNTDTLDFSKNEQQETETISSKKFVFKIDAENIDFIESLGYQEKNEIINKMLQDYQNSSVLNKKFNSSINITKKATIIVIAALIGIPLVIFLVGLSVHFTKISYTKMQTNFEKLF